MIKLTAQQEKLRRQITSPVKFGFFLLTQLPMGWMAGLRVKELTAEKCVTTLPFKWLNKNPFRSTYFAVQSMAAELSTAAPCLLAVKGHQPSVALIIVDFKATFLKKAVDRIYFTCEDGFRAFSAVEKAIEAGEAQTATFKTTGKMKDGTVVSAFEVTWSFKQRHS